MKMKQDRRALPAYLRSMLTICRCLGLYAARVLFRFRFQYCEAKATRRLSALPLRRQEKISAVLYSSAYRAGMSLQLTPHAHRYGSSVLQPFRRAETTLPL